MTPDHDWFEESAVKVAGQVPTVTTPVQDLVVAAVLRNQSVRSKSKPYGLIAEHTGAPRGTPILRSSGSLTHTPLHSPTSRSPETSSRGC